MTSYLNQFPLKYGVWQYNELKPIMTRFLASLCNIVLEVMNEHEETILFLVSVDFLITRKEWENSKKYIVYAEESNIEAMSQSLSMLRELQEEKLNTIITDMESHLPVSATKRYSVVTNAVTSSEPQKKLFGYDYASMPNSIEAVFFKRIVGCAATARHSIHLIMHSFVFMHVRQVVCKYLLIFTICSTALY